MKTKFELGDFVFVIEKDNNLIRKNLICPNCNGEKVFYTKLFQKEFVCSKCDGSGKIEIIDKTWGVNNCTLKIMHIYLEDETIQYSGYSFYSEDLDFQKESDLFLTEKEAQEECDRRNKNGV